jgi:AraC family transcriptional regulator
MVPLMNPRHRTFECAFTWTDLQARHVRRIGDLSAELQPDFASEQLGLEGVFAETYTVTREIDVGPFGLEDHVIILLHKGTLGACLLFAGAEQVLAMGGVILVPAATSMMLRLFKADFTIVYLNPKRIPGVQPSVIHGRELVPTLDPDDVQLPLLVSSIRAEMQARFPTGPAYFESLAQSLITRAYGLYSVAAAASGTFRGGLTARQVRQAKTRILTDLDKYVPLAALAEEARLSPSYFCRAFKQSTGTSPHQWQLEKRFERAQRLMSDDRISLTTIALTLGFASLSHFSAAFKRATGLSPSHYRRKAAS